MANVGSMSLKSQDACDFVIGRLSDTLGRPSLANSDSASGTLAVALTIAIAIVGGRQCLELAQRLAPVPSFEEFAENFAARRSLELPAAVVADPVPETAINSDSFVQRR